MGVPAKGFNAYHQDVCNYTQIKPEDRELINKTKRKNQEAEAFSAGFDKPNGKPCTDKNRKYD